MTDDRSPDFGALEARAEALAGQTPPDRLSLRDHVVMAEIGAFQHERGHGQRLRFNVVVELAAQTEAGDDVDRILSYDRITEAIAAELGAERLNLLETLADRVAARILAEPQAARVFLRVEKLDLAPGALGVEIVRDRAAVAAPVAEAGPRPVVHLLSPGALPEVTEAGGAVLVPAAPGLPLPAAATPETLRRIALLALEQAAWSLAGRDPALSVVATRTELDWALKRGRRVVWAPAKLALDTPGAPQSADPAVLGAWLAELIGAEALVVHGPVAFPAVCRVPVRSA